MASQRSGVAGRDDRVPAHLLLERQVVLIHHGRLRLRIPNAVRDVAGSHASQARVREARIVDLCRLQESGPRVLVVQPAHDFVVVNAGAAADHRPVFSPWHPRKAETRCEVPERRISREDGAKSRRNVRNDIPDVGLVASDFSRDRHELVAHAKIERERLGDLPVVLKVVAYERLPEPRCRSGIQGECHKPGRPGLQERSEIGELVLCLARLRLVVVLDALEVETQSYGVCALLHVHVVSELSNVLRELLRRGVQVADVRKRRHLRIDRPRPAGHETTGIIALEIHTVLQNRVRPVEGSPHHVEYVRGENVLVLQRDEHITGSHRR